MNKRPGWFEASTAICLTALTALTSAHAMGKRPNKVIYGNDDRRNFSEITDSRVIEQARATAAMIPVARLSSGLRGTIVRDSTVGSSMGLCEDEPFREEISAAMCSGFLIGPDTLITAGHCVESMSDCSASNWVFDYTDVNVTASGEITVPQTSVYSCAQILDQAWESATKLDYAVIKLDRPVTDRTPLRYRSSGSVQAGEPIVVIGYPSGIPLKVAAGAQVRDNSDPVYFSANLDTYGGNSGSAVLNEATGEVEGILVRGEQDYTSAGGCTRSFRCTDTGCRGEDVTRITQIRYLNGGQPQPPVGDGGGTRPPTPGEANSCEFANDGACDDGRPGSQFNVCARGTDENDCSATSPIPVPVGPNSCEFANDGACDDGRPGSQFNVCTPGTDENDCSATSPIPVPVGPNSCEFANDGACDDGRPGSQFDVCEPGTDENDCTGIGAKSLPSPLTERKKQEFNRFLEKLRTEKVLKAKSAN